MKQLYFMRHGLSDMNKLGLFSGRTNTGLAPEGVEQCRNAAKTTRVNLGPVASEELARNKRYEFLNRIVQETNAEALITAHHQDDLIETAIINMIRGTGRVGFGSIRENEHIKRPLLIVSKNEIIDYALKQGLVWREDSTNLNDAYLRNRIRHNIVPKMNSNQRQTFLNLIYREGKLNDQIDQLFSMFFEEKKTQLNRYVIKIMPYDVSRELIATWLRMNNLLNFNHKTIERLTLAAKTKPAGVKLDVTGKYVVNVTRDYLALRSPER